MQTLAADVQGLRKGLDLTKSERDKQPENFIIFVSFGFVLFFSFRCSAYNLLQRLCYFFLDEAKRTHHERNGKRFSRV